MITIWFQEFSHLTKPSSSVIYGFFGSFGTKIINKEVHTIIVKTNLYPKPMLVKSKDSANNLPPNRTQAVNIKFQK